MEQKSKFDSAFSFKNSVVKSGSKVSGFANPTFSVDTTKDKFTLDSKAMAMMSLVEGSKVVLIDQNTDDVNNRFFITPGFKVGNEICGAKLGKNSSFSYSKVWSAMLIGKQGVTEAKPTDLVKLGLAELREGSKIVDVKDEDGNVTGQKEVSTTTYIALKKMFFEVEQVIGENGETEFEVADGISQPVYRLTNVISKKHDPKEVA
jgi:hypothetical protein